VQEVIFPIKFRCGEVLAEPTGGKLELRDGVHIRRKAE
jgi:ribosomal protein S27E